MAELTRMFELRFDGYTEDDDAEDTIHVRLSERMALDLYEALHEVFGGTCRCEEA